VTTGRLEAFSDGVLAVAITLLALDLRVPEIDHGSLWHELLRQWPNYVAYATSFLTVGIIWINHHAALRRLRRIDHTGLILNVVLLMTVCVLPFTTALMARYLDRATGSSVAAAVSGGSFLVMSFAFVALQRHVLLARADLANESLSPEARMAVLRRNLVGSVPYAAATALAFVSAYLTLAICAAIAVFYALPSTTADAGALE
jgi:uncharacterized membrane protein